MTESAPVHGFVALELPRRSIEGLHAVQRAIRTMVQAAELVPRRLLCLPLVDFGPRQIEVFEAAELALTRATQAAEPLEIVCTGVEVWPNTENPRLVRVMVDDEDGRFAQLRDAVHRELARYGFPLPEGPWNPHIPLARLPEGTTDLPEFDHRGLVPVKGRRVTLIQRARGRFRPRRSIDLAKPKTATDENTSEASERARIAALLDARVAQRNERPRTARRRRRRVDNLETTDEAVMAEDE